MPRANICRYGNSLRALSPRRTRIVPVATAVCVGFTCIVGLDRGLLPRDPVQDPRFNGFHCYDFFRVEQGYDSSKKLTRRDSMRNNVFYRSAFL